ncbi:hypothetical protein GJ744_001987 [Endocarpon pusillum]|uniref:Ecp2 effector protein domain-containing protein n=1 Tax=Endocarpon pusillum TaxID=364733 RepID=A0A8H7A8S5_9EURO|nr:hypothetical protein GJ744_001987 [Endocarpon pusillum]
MAFSKVLSLCLIIPLSSANPVFNSLSRVGRSDDPPKPSKYPLGDPCGHEWQYLNFKPDDAADKSHLRNYTERSAMPYNRYFPPKEGHEEDGDYPKRVESILKAITGESSTEGRIGAIVADMIVDDKGFAGNGENPGQGTCADEGTLGYCRTWLSNQMS